MIFPCLNSEPTTSVPNSNRPPADRNLEWRTSANICAGLWDELYAPARDEHFFRAQTRTFPDDQGLALMACRVAFRQALLREEIVLGAEFGLRHAERHARLNDRSPLDLLRRGNLQAARNRANSAPAEDASVWLLLLAAELAGQEQLESAKAVLSDLAERSPGPAKQPVSRHRRCASGRRVL